MGAPRDDAILPRKRPRQARSAATVDAILEAATRILRASQTGDLNTNRVADIAGISIGSLYQYFPNKASLIAALIERQQEALASSVERIVSDSGDEPLIASLSMLVDAAIDHQFGDRFFAAALDYHEIHLPVSTITDAAQARIVAAVHALLEKHWSTFSAAVPKSAAIDCMIITKSMVENASKDQSANIPELKTRVVHALHAYLMGVGSPVLMRADSNSAKEGK